MTSGAATAVARSELKRARGTYAGLALVLALGGGASMGAAILADRTDSAYPEYVDRAEVSDLVINPSVSSTTVDAAIRSFDGVKAVHSHSLLLASVSQTTPGTIDQLASINVSLQVLGSTDGDFTAVNRPVASSGHLPTGDHQIFVSDDYRHELDTAVGRALRVGDTIDMAFWWNALASDDYRPEGVVAPIGVEHLRISGFGQLPDEVIPDELYPRQRLIVSADVARRYSCVPVYRADMDEQEAFDATFPPTCADLYRYWSVELDDSPGRIASIRQQFSDSVSVLESQLPRYFAEHAYGYYFISQERADVDAAVHQTTRPTVTALYALVLIAFASTLTIFALALTRALRRTMPINRTLFAIGATLRQQTLATLAPPLVATLAGLVGAIGLAAMTSMLGPLGSVGALQPTASISLPGAVFWPTVAALVVGSSIILFITSFVAARRSIRTDLRPARPLWRASVTSWGRTPAFIDGTRAALGGGRPGAVVAVIAGCIVAVTSIVAVAVFASNLTTLVDHPVAYGWSWDAAVITDGGYGDTVPEQVAASLDRDNDVVSYELYALDPSTQFGQRGVPVIFAYAGSDSTSFPLVSGRLPRRAGEAVLGSATAETLHVRVGDHVSMNSTIVPDTDVEVVGMAVLPALGSLIADRTGLGTGAFVLTSDELTVDNATLTGIRLRPGVDSRRFLARLGPLESWTSLGQAPYTYSSPIRPPEIIDLSALRSGPALLVAILGLALAAGLTLSIVVSVRDRRVDLAVLRALGFGNRDLHASVRWQAVATMGIGLLLGLPLGIAAGRGAWRRFADQLGVVPRAGIPIVALAVTLAACLILAIIAAAIPARSITHAAPTDMLRRA